MNRNTALKSLFVSLVGLVAAPIVTAAQKPMMADNHAPEDKKVAYLLITRVDQNVGAIPELCANFRFDTLEIMKQNVRHMYQCGTTYTEKYGFIPRFTDDRDYAKSSMSRGL